jgi:hypothetical protein
MLMPVLESMSRSALRHRPIESDADQSGKTTITPVGLLGPPTKFTTLTNVPLHTPVKRPMTGYLTDGIVQYLKQ